MLTFLRSSSSVLVMISSMVHRCVYLHSLHISGLFRYLVSSDSAVFRQNGDVVVLIHFKE